MKHLLREYGIIILLTAVGIGGYLIFSQNRDNILSYSLDVIGDRLVGMIEDPASKALIAERFEGFKDKVLRQEVDASAVEGMTASVLNLSSSGATLSREQARLMLDVAESPESMSLPEPFYPGTESLNETYTRTETLSSDEPADDNSAGVVPEQSKEAYKAAVVVADLEELGSRLGALVDFHIEVSKMTDGSPDGRTSVRVRTDRDTGLQFELDSSVAVMMNDKKMARMERRMKDLERHRMIVWSKNLSEEVRADREKTGESLEFIRMNRPPAVEAEELVGEFELRLKSLEELRNLELHGYVAPVNLERIEHFVARQLKNAINVESIEDGKREELEHYLQKIDHWISEASRNIVLSDQDQ